MCATHKGKTVSLRGKHGIKGRNNKIARLPLGLRGKGTLPKNVFAICELKCWRSGLGKGQHRNIMY
ncbi:MAG: hypothetical protein AB1467_02600 [Candidatus Diapherotrites archaeon]